MIFTGWQPVVQNLKYSKEVQFMKIFMHWDMEGVSGLYTQEHVWYWEEGVREHIAEEGKMLLMADMNSATEATLKAGVDEIIVCDTHHGGDNMKLDKMLSDHRITYLNRSVGYEGTERRWMPGLNENFDGIMLLGHHAKAGTENAFLPHTWTLEWADFRINDQSVGEIGIEACYAGHWDVPLIMVQGDEGACRETAQQFPGVVTASVKRSQSYELCSGLDPVAARELTAQKVIEAIEKARKGQFSPYKPKLPMTVTIKMKTAEGAKSAAQKPGVKQIDEYTLEGCIQQQCDIVKWILGTGLKMQPRK